jgi:hypothetical protein
MSATLNYLRLYADEADVSHFAPLEIEISPQDFAPPAPPFSASALAPASRYGLLHLPSGGVGDLHPSPLHMWAFCRGKWSSRPVTGSGTILVLEVRCSSKTPLVPVTAAA